MRVSPWKQGLGRGLTCSLMLGATLALTAQPADARKKDRKAASAEAPYASTYKPYPGAPTLVRNVTIYDGEGGRIDNGSALFADGKVVAVGPQVDAPAGATVIDGAGKWLTPGVIDIHSHLGNGPSPSVGAQRA